jgi:hypothetical protein
MEPENEKEEINHAVTGAATGIAAGSRRCQAVGLSNRRRAL